MEGPPTALPEIQLPHTNCPSVAFTAYTAPFMATPYTVSSAPMANDVLIAAPRLIDRVITPVT